MNWIKSAIKHPGALRHTLHTRKGKSISMPALKSASHKPGVTGRRARLAMTLRKLNH